MTVIDDARAASAALAAARRTHVTPIGTLCTLERQWYELELLAARAIARDAASDENRHPGRPNGAAGRTPAAAPPAGAPRAPGSSNPGGVPLSSHPTKYVLQKG